MALDNTTVLDKVRVRSSWDYQQKVPQADQVGLDRTVDVLESDLSLMNEFHRGLVNLIASQIVRQWDFANPLAEFKRENIREGDSIQEIAVNLLRANGYDMRDNNLFKRNPAEVKAKIHKLNRKSRYDLTINRAEVAQAFKSENGLNELIARELQVPGISDEYDEFNVMKNLIAHAFATDRLAREKVTFVDPKNPTVEEIEKLSITLRTLGGKMKYPSGLYNAEGVPTVSNYDNLVIIVTPEVKANMDVKVLANAFNQDMAAFVHRVIEIDEFPMAGVHAMIVDRNWFVCADYLRDVTDFWNAKSLEHNFYLHHWGLYAYSPYVSAVIIGNFDSTAIDLITITLDSLSAEVIDEDGTVVTKFSYGDELKLVVETAAEITPDNPVFVAPSGYEASISLETAAGAGIDKTLATSYTRSGYLRVQEGLKAGDKIVINVVSTYVDPSGDGEAPVAPLTDTVTLTVA